MNNDLGIDKNYVYVGIWKRFIALIMDIVISLPIIILNAQVSKYSIKNDTIFPMILFSGVWYIFYIFFIVKYGGTPGKLFMKIRIVNDNGEFISISKAVLRLIPVILSNQISILISLNPYSNLTDMLEIFIALFIIIDVLVILFNREKRALHDYLAGSFVIEKEIEQR